jgi:hypothetical protein
MRYLELPFAAGHAILGVESQRILGYDKGLLIWPKHPLTRLLP